MKAKGEGERERKREKSRATQRIPREATAVGVLIRNAGDRLPRTLSFTFSPPISISFPSFLPFSLSSYVHELFFLSFPPSFLLSFFLLLLLLSLRLTQVFVSNLHLIPETITKPQITSFVSSPSISDLRSSILRLISRALFPSPFHSSRILKQRPERLPSVSSSLDHLCSWHFAFSRSLNVCSFTLFPIPLF